MARIVVILPTSTYRAGDFITAGDELGVDLIVASEGAPPIEMGDRYLEIDCSDPELAAKTIVAAGNTMAIDGIVAADDRGVVIAALAGTELGLPANTPASAMATRDKSAQRRLLSAGEVPQPDWSLVESSQDPGPAAATVGYPLVVKPRSRSAGQGVIRVDRPEDLEQSVERVRAILEDEGDPERSLIVESLLSGSEVAVEGLIGPGGLETLAIFDKPDVLTGSASRGGFEETILITPSRLSGEVVTEVIRVAEQAVRALGLTRGPVHIELMVNGGKVHVIEVAGRSIGGLCSRSLSFGLLDTSLESLILRNAIDRDKPELRRSPESSGVLMIPIPGAGVFAGMSGLDEVRSLETVTGIDITVSPGERIAPPPEGGRYLGFVFARGDGVEQVESDLCRAMSIIEVSLR